MEQLLDELKRYVDLDASDQAALRAFGLHAAPHFATIGAACQAEIRALPEADAQALPRDTLSVWLRHLLTGPWDPSYLERRAEFARTHIAGKMPRSSMVGVIGTIRIQLQAVADTYLTNLTQRSQLSFALHRLLDLELAIALESQREATQRARRAERLASLGTMAAGLAHELRNPLNSANLQLSVARKRLERGTSNDAEPALRAIELAEAEHRRLAALVDDFLAFAKPHPLQLSRADLCSVAAHAVDSMSAEASAAGVELSYTPAAALPVELDTSRMREVLVNLVRNAIEATPRGGQVRVQCERLESVARLAVRDDGCGFASDAAIFQPFYTTKHEGTGLGLAIVHRIVIDHGGSVDALSEPGRTQFTITLPLADEATS